MKSKGEHKAEGRFVCVSFCVSTVLRVSSPALISMRSSVLSFVRYLHKCV